MGLLALLLWCQSSNALLRPPITAPSRTPVSNRAAVLAVTQVVTDIDDTIKSSGGVALAGIPLGGVDTSVTRNSFYPGVFQFGLELSLGSVFFRRKAKPVAILTARAREFKAFLEIKQSSKLCERYRQVAQARGIPRWGVGPVLYGSVQEWICQERKGWRKFENFKLLRESNSESTRYAPVPTLRSNSTLPRQLAQLSLRRGSYVFIGDNGKSEKDLEAAHMMISAYPGLMRAVFIHAVSGDVQPAPLPRDYNFEGHSSEFVLRWKRTWLQTSESPTRVKTNCEDPLQS
ncbi:MAG: hypothetical protein SGPRY_004818 [Prymnesium sp.]